MISDIKIPNIRQELIDYLSINKDRPIEELVDNMLKNYNIHKKPKKSCFECIHYKKIHPGEITYVGDHFPDIESCSMGHNPGSYTANFCKDYFSTKTMGVKKWLKHYSSY